VSKVVENVAIPVGVAGGMRADTAPLAISSGAKLAVVGGSITRAADPEKATVVILEAIGRKVTVS
ncbi:MAG: orotidine 5'-phosphate decarboxylase, partial [Candidatus Aenigmarchaeota archaeon]|nr:orotidine 5'-phosphate decarboxylase [Candidatus Aenigmarchaeota archaeon]